MRLRILLCLALAAASLSASAQQSSAGSPVTGTSNSPSVIPKNGQSPQQTWTDRYACDRWAVNQSGVDPYSLGAASTNPSDRQQYMRAFAACMEGRGYGLGTPAAPPAPLPLPLRSGPTSLVLTPQKPELAYHPFAFQLEGGYTPTAGATHKALDGGSNIGAGITWLPFAALPVGLRIDGQYSWFRMTSAAVQGMGTGYTHGSENIYGGDADLQLDLAHQSAGYKFYLFGGAGWYREATRLRADQFERGAICGFYYCFPGYLLTETASRRSTGPWRDSWNAGLGFETAVADRMSLFIEARYQRIGPVADKLDFVPIRVGLRF